MYIIYFKLRRPRDRKFKKALLILRNTILYIFLEILFKGFISAQHNYVFCEAIFGVMDSGSDGIGSEENRNKI